VPVQGDRGLLAVCDKAIGQEVKKETPSRSYYRPIYDLGTRIERIQY